MLALKETPDKKPGKDTRPYETYNTKAPELRKYSKTLAKGCTQGNQAVKATENRREP